MADKIVELLNKITTDSNLIVLLISMFPLVELKGAIPIGMKLGQTLFQAAGLAYIGSTIVCVPVFFLLQPVFYLLKKIKFIKKLVLKIENVFYEKAEKINRKALEESGAAGKTVATDLNGAGASGDKVSRGEYPSHFEEDPVFAARAKKIMLWSLFVFVAVPFPVTGVWTGTAIAVFLGLKFREAVLPLAAGNLIAGGIITLLSFFFKDYVDTIIFALVVIAVIMLVVFIVKIALSKPKSDNNDKAD